MTEAFQPFVQYITDLADGKFDGYFDSIEPPKLLLHSLENNQKDPQLTRLFRSDTVFASFDLFLS